MMSGRKNTEVPRRLTRAAARFAAWRRMHAPHTRIPKFLWTAAAKLAADFGVSCTATQLKLNYYDLKKHLEAIPVPSTRPLPKKSPGFLELPGHALATSGECVIELENTVGATMRIHIKGSDCPDLVALSTAFYNGKS